MVHEVITCYYLIHINDHVDAPTEKQGTELAQIKLAQVCLVHSAMSTYPRWLELLTEVLQIYGSFGGELFGFNFTSSYGELQQ